MRGHNNVDIFRLDFNKINSERKITKLLRMYSVLHMMTWISIGSTKRVEKVILF